MAVLALGACTELVAELPRTSTGRRIFMSKRVMAGTCAAAPTSGICIRLVKALLEILVARPAYTSEPVTVDGSQHA